MDVFSLDPRRMMASSTAVAKAAQALGSEYNSDSRAVASLAGALLVREGLVALARVLFSGRSRAKGGDVDVEDAERAVRQDGSETGCPS